MRRLALLLFALVSWTLLAWGCDGGDDAGGPATNVGSGHGGGPYDGGVGDAAGGNGGDGGSMSDAGMFPVRVGLTANPLSDDAGVSTPSDELLAELTAFAAGVRVVVIEVGWDSLDPNDLSSLSTRIDVYAQRNLEVVLSLLAVDRKVARRPSALDGLAWDDAAVVADMHALVDALGASVGPKLRALLINRATDSYFAANPGTAAQHTSFLTQTLARVASAMPAVQRGVGVRFVGSDPSGLHQSLVDLGDVAAFEYMPGAGQATLPADASPARDLDVMIEQAGGRPVVIQAVGFTAAAGLAKTAVDQQLAFDAFFAALNSRRAAFPIVNVFQLHDLVDQACTDFATAQGIGPTDPLADYVCEAGLRDGQDQPKDAWYSLLAATARFAQP